MKLLISATMAAMLAATAMAPAWADRGHGKRPNIHHHVYHVPPGHVKKLQRYQVQRRWHPRPVMRYYSPSYVYPVYPGYTAYPVYPGYRPAPGVSIVLPDVFIRF